MVVLGCALIAVWVDKMCTVFFFFQAEDGIRDLTVTGVQTCALPIYVRKGKFPARFQAASAPPQREWFRCYALAPCGYAMACRRRLRNHARNSRSSPAPADRKILRGRAVPWDQHSPSQSGCNWCAARKL